MTRVSAKYLAKRLVASYLSLLVVMTLLFVLIRAMPGSFLQIMINPEMTAEDIERIKEVWGLDEPLWKQYLNFMINYQTGEFGWSPYYKVPIWRLVKRRLPRTLVLFGATFFMGFLIGPLVGMYLGWWRGTTRDRATFMGGLLAYSMPAFWLAWLWIWLLDYHLKLLPSSYMNTQFPTGPSYDYNWVPVNYGPQFEWTAVTLIGDVLWHLTLPILSITAISWVGSMLVMRTQMTNVVDQDYVFLARAKGLSERKVMIKHAARNALIPVATNAIVGVVTIIDGAVLIENVFNYPGVGLLLVSAVLNSDYPTAQAIFFVLAALLIFMRLVTDVVYTYLDPRIKFGEQGGA